MTSRRLALALVLVVLAASVGVGAASPAASPGVAGAAAADQVATPTDANATTDVPLGHSISSVMQAGTTQTSGAVENGMWAAAYANASNASEKRALVQQRFGQLNTTVAELQAERAALREQFRDGEIDRATYHARLSAVVGRLAALDEGLEETGERGAAVGVNRTRLDDLRTRARSLSGPEVSRLARNLTGGQGGPGASGIFGDGPPGRSGERGPPNGSNGSTAGNG